MATASELAGQPAAQLPQTNGTANDVTPMRAGTIGAACGLGVGLLFGDLIVPGVIIVAAGIVGMAAVRSKFGKVAKA
jgi:hypothetical protein